MCLKTLSSHLSTFFLNKIISIMSILLKNMLEFSNGCIVMCVCVRERKRETVRHSHAR